jgi:hypothetical protein
MMHIIFTKIERVARREHIFVDNIRLPYKTQAATCVGKWAGKGTPCGV